MVKIALVIQARDARSLQRNLHQARSVAGALRDDDGSRWRNHLNGLRVRSRFAQA